MKRNRRSPASGTPEEVKHHKFDWVDAIFLVIVIGLPCLIVYLLLRG